MLRILFIGFLLFTLVLSAFSQGQEDWTKRTKVEAEKILDFSAWGKLQTDTDTSELFYSPTRPGTSSIGASSASRATTGTQQAINNNRADQGAVNQAVSVNYHIRLFSARPIREAIARLVVLNQDHRYEELTALMQPFVDRNFGPYVVLTVAFDSNDGRALGPVLQAFSVATADTLRNKTYLERKDGKKLYLMDYRAPSADGLGAKFVFEREPGGKAFITENAGNFRFFSEVSSKIKLNVRYSIAELTYNGKLEY